MILIVCFPHLNFLPLTLGTDFGEGRDQAKINMIEWDAVIADECQKVKERTSGITEAMNVVNSLCRIGLTGTAIMNHYGVCIRPYISGI